MKLQNNEQFFRIIKDKNIVIYGDGYVGKTFLKMLKFNDLENKVICFTKSIVNDVIEVDGIKVQPIEYVKSISNSIICIAVHESNKDEIIKKLIKNNIYNYIWIYPILHSLMIGEPKKKNVRIPVKNIVNGNVNDYRMAARYLAIENYYGKNTIGYDIYIKLMELHASRETARKRLLNFIQLIENWDENGYDNVKCIDILENYILIDGAHRFTLGVYSGLDYMTCNIYDASIYNNGSVISGKGAMMDKAYVRENIKNNEIIKKLDEVVYMIMTKYNC